MYQAELRGKLPSSVARLEDILTSNVFSFLKYANREMFLKNYMRRLGFKITASEAIEAEFIFWPCFEDKTEPDLVIIAGPYYFLIEAKYFSGFGQETPLIDAQLIREIRGGLLDAQNYSKQFKLIVITADHIYPKAVFSNLDKDLYSYLTWTNWQNVTFLLNEVINSNKYLTEYEKTFALDLVCLLDQKRLRSYQGLEIIAKNLPELIKHPYIFFKSETAVFRGSFIGFRNSLFIEKELKPTTGKLFFSPKKGR